MGYIKTSKGNVFVPKLQPLNAPLLASKDLIAWIDEHWDEYNEWLSENIGSGGDCDTFDDNDTLEMRREFYEDYYDDYNYDDYDYYDDYEGDE